MLQNSGNWGVFQGNSRKARFVTCCNISFQIRVGVYAVELVDVEPIEIVVMHGLIKASESGSQATRMRCFKFCNSAFCINFTLGVRCDWLFHLKLVIEAEPVGPCAYARLFYGNITSFIVQIVRTSFPTFDCHTPF